MKNLLAAITIFSVLTGLAAYSQSIPKFNYISKDEGLASDKILCIAQSRNGFMWFGTEDGLTRFDGSNYRIFRNEPGNKYSLIDNYVNTVYEDPFSGNLWIGTAKGLCYLNIKEYKFYSASTKSDSVQGLNTYSILIDDQQNRWVGTFNGLFKYSRGSSTPTLCLQNKDKRYTNVVNCIFADSEKTIWVCTDFGLYYIKPHDLKPTLFKFKEGVFKVISIYEDRHKNLWISTFSEGVLKIKGDQLTKYSLENGSLKSNKVYGVVEDEDGNMYMAVKDGGGLHYLDSRTNKIKVFTNDIFNQSGINSTALTCIFKDKFKNIWIGSMSKGLNLIDYNHNAFEHYKVNYRSDGLLSNFVRSVFQDSDGDIWIGTKEYGTLSKFDPKNGRFVHYKSCLYNPKTRQFSFVLSISEAKPGQLLVGTLDKGLIVYNKKTGSYTTYLHDPADKNSVADNRVTNVFKDRYNVIWVSAGRDLQLFDPVRGKFKLMQASCHVRCFFDYSPDEIFFGGNMGLFSYNRKTHKLIHFQRERNLNGKDLLDITGILKDKSGNLWLATSGNGLVRFDPKSRKTKVYTIRNGLASNIICGIQADNKGNLWLSTTNGLSKFNPATGKFRNYFVGEGLQGNGFEKYASLKTRDNHLIFGGNNGFNYFHPDSIKDNFSIPKVILTGFKVFNKSVNPDEEDSPLSEDISSAESLTLNYKQSVFTLEFSALNFSPSVYNQYAYKLEPLEKEWNYIGSRNAVSYSSLPAGNYTFKVMAANNNGTWNSRATVLPIRVLPAPWKSPWAYLGYIAVITGLVAFWIRYKNFETRLKIAQLEKEKLNELNNIKSQFFTNISHEFKTPLTMILSPLNKLLKKLDDEEDKKYLGYINRNALRLQNLINQLMEFKSIESNKLLPQYIKGDICRFIKELIQVFEPLAQDHAIKMTLESPHSITTYYDPDKTEKIFYNILSNALKFTPKNGSITVSIKYIDNHNDAKTSFDGAYIQISIGNTGSEIDPDHLPHLFENYYHINRPNSLSQPGTGIGLAFTKELVEVLGGTIAVESTEDLTSFTVSLPDIKALATDFELKDASCSGFAYTQQYLEVLKFEKADTNWKGTNQKAPSILLVEDNSELRGLLLNLLARNYKITLAADGQEGLELARKMNPELIISDIIMPKLSGIELCKEVKTNVELNHIPVILLTASHADAQKINGMENGADVYIEKPFNLDFLKLQVKNIIQTRAAQREAFAKKISAEPEKETINSPNEQWLQTAISIVEQNLSNPEFDVDDFVEEMNMSRTSLYRKIKAITDLSVNEFIINIRLKKAMHLLLHSDLNISEVAYRTGFNTPQYFGVCFKKNLKVSPRQFVEKNRKSSAVSISTDNL